jgi:hypothetical protein
MLKINSERIETDILRFTLKANNGYTTQKIEIKEGNKYTPLLSSFDKLSTLIFYSKSHNFSRSTDFQSEDKSSLNYSYDGEDYNIKLEIELCSENLLHFKYELLSKQEIFLLKLLATYEIMLGNDPDFTWVPHIIPRKNFVIGDHVFRSPVIIYGKNNLYFALIPDLEILGRNRRFKTFLDLELKTKSNGETPYVSFGFGNYRLVKHFLFKQDLKTPMEIKENETLTFGYYIKILKIDSILEVLKELNNLLWNTYGKNQLYGDINPQIVSYDTNVKEGFKAILHRHKCI